MLLIYVHSYIIQYIIMLYGPKEVILQFKTLESNSEKLSYGVPVLQYRYVMSNNHMTTRYITPGYWRVMWWWRIWQLYVSVKLFSAFEAITSHFKQSWDEQILTLVVISFHSCKIFYIYC